MLKRLIHFIKYNNVAVLVILAVFLLAGGALATETGQDLIGGRETTIEGVDNTLLLEADLDKLDMEFKIEKIEEDEKMYYVTYTYLDLAESNGVWRYQIKEKVRQVSKKLRKDLGQYLAEELAEEYDLRIKELRQAQAQAKEKGETKRVEVVEYTGLIGKFLDTAGRIFPDYEPVKKRELAAEVSESFLSRLAEEEQGQVLGEFESDDLTQVYNDFVSENDPDKDNVFYFDDNCPMIFNPDQIDSDLDGVGDVCDIDSINATEEEAVTGTEDKSQITNDKSQTNSKSQNTNFENNEVSQDNQEVEIIKLDEEEESETGEEESGEEIQAPAEEETEDLSDLLNDEEPAEGEGDAETPVPAEETEEPAEEPAEESADISSPEPESIFEVGETEMVEE